MAMMALNGPVEAVDVEVAGFCVEVVGEEEELSISERRFVVDVNIDGAVLDD